MSAALNFSELDQNVELLPARTLLSTFSRDVVGSTGGASGGVSGNTVFGNLGDTSAAVVNGNPMSNVGNFVSGFVSGGR
jgi:hypothetical protein